MSRPHAPLPLRLRDSTLADLANGSSLELRPEETIHTWIGTNDVGVNGLLSGNQAPGVTIVDVVACAVNWVKALLCVRSEELHLLERLGNVEC